MQSIFPQWAENLSPVQQQALLHDDIVTWLASISQEDPVFHPEMFWQYRIFVNRNNNEDAVDDAIALLQGDSPRIFTVIQECFHVSLLLLQERFPDFFPTSRVDAFFHTDAKQQVQNKGKKNAAQQDAILPDDVRAQAMSDWLADDYRFYQAAVQQFRQRVLQSCDRLPSHLVQECFDTLDDRTMTNKRFLLDQ